MPAPVSSRGTTFNGGTITSNLAVEDASPEVRVTAPDGSRAFLAASVDAATLSLKGSGASPLVELGIASADLVFVEADVEQSAEFHIANTGHTFIHSNTAPVDAALGPGVMCLWLDETNGAAKLMVKAKQADGTVRTAAIALA